MYTTGGGENESKSEGCRGKTKLPPPPPPQPHCFRMAILASREHTYIDPEVVRMKSKREGCRERLDSMVTLLLLMM